MSKLYIFHIASRDEDVADGFTFHIKLSSFCNLSNLVTLELINVSFDSDSEPEMLIAFPFKLRSFKVGHVQGRSLPSFLAAGSQQSFTLEMKGYSQHSNLVLSQAATTLSTFRAKISVHDSPETAYSLLDLSPLSALTVLDLDRISAFSLRKILQHLPSTLSILKTSIELDTESEDDPIEMQYLLDCVRMDSMKRIVLWELSILSWHGDDEVLEPLLEECKNVRKIDLRLDWRLDGGGWAEEAGEDEEAEATAQEQAELSFKDREDMFDPDLYDDEFLDGAPNYPTDDEYHSD